MKTQSILILLLTAILVAAGVAYKAGVIPAGLLNGVSANNGQQQAVPASNPNNPVQDVADTAVTLQQGDIEKLLTTVAPDQKKALLNDTAAFRKFINQEAMNLSLLRAARASKLGSDPTTQFLAERGADNVLREIYMTSFINSKIPKDYPNEEQIKQYYEANKGNLQVAERLSVWQIFLPVTQDMDETAAAAVAREAERIASEIKSGKLAFDTAALQYSKHETSRLNGGYMGIIKTSDLLPEISRIIAELKPGEVSTAIKSAMGYHILKKGELFPVQELTLDQIHGEIRNVMINQARTQLRDAINTEVMKTYPVSVDDATVGKWRQQMLSGQ